MFTIHSLRNCTHENMGPKTALLLCCTLLFAPNSRSENLTATNLCDSSLQRHLQCDYRGTTYVNPVDALQPDVYSLTLRNSSYLHLDPSHYQSGNYRGIVSHRIVGNRRLAVEPGSFEGLQGLRYLAIQDNDWETIGDGAFRGLQKLELLTISNGGVETVQPNAFSGLVGLETLDVTFNKFSRLPDGAFADLGSLASLFLHHNGIEAIGNGAFVGLARLTTLDLSHNKIARVDTSGFNVLPKLSHLFLSHNRISRIEGQFRIQTLNVVDLQNNKLKQIPDDLFNNAVNLKGIDVSYNEITSLSDEPFKNLPFLLHLNVRGNKINDLTKLQQLQNTLLTY